MQMILWVHTKNDLLEIKNWPLSENEILKSNSWKTGGVIINVKYLIILSCVGKFVGRTR